MNPSIENLQLSTPCMLGIGLIFLGVIYLWGTVRRQRRADDQVKVTVYLSAWKDNRIVRFYPGGGEGIERFLDKWRQKAGYIVSTRNISGYTDENGKYTRGAAKVACEVPANDVEQFIRFAESRAGRYGFTVQRGSV